MTLTAPQLESIVRAAKATGENQVTTQLADGTIIEIRLRPQPEKPFHPLALLMQRLRHQKPTTN
jgi:hypothetical protein